MVERDAALAARFQARRFAPGIGAAFEPQLVMAEQERATCVGVGHLQVVAAAPPVGMVEVAVKPQLLGCIPVQRGAILAGAFHLLGRQPKHRAGVQQIVAHDTGRQAVGLWLIPVIEHAGLPAQVQVVAPTAIEVLPLGRLVYERFTAGGFAAIFDQPYLHFVDTPRQHPGIQRLQPRLHLLAVDQRAVAVNLHQTRSVGSYMDGHGTGLAVIHQQAIAAAEHHPKGGTGGVTQHCGLAHQPLGLWHHIPKPPEVLVLQALGVQLRHTVRIPALPPVATVNLGICQPGPATQAALPHQVDAPAGAVAIVHHIELIAQQKARAALLGYAVITGRLRGFFGIAGQQRQLRVGQAVMHGLEAARAVMSAIAERAPGCQVPLPQATQVRRLMAILGIGEFQQLHAVIAGQDHHGIAQVAPIQLYAHGQRHIKKMGFEFGWQPFDSAQDNSRIAVTRPAVER